MKNTKSVLEPENIYHIYNRAIGQEKLFLSDENYMFFLRRYNQYLQPVVDTLCYCLMPNHFHFLIRVKNEKSLRDYFQGKIQNEQKASSSKRTYELLNTLVSRQFSNFFNSYAKAFNKQQKRKGSLFIHTFKRKPVTDISYCRKLIHYIHYNPIAARLTNAYDWKYSSYHSIVSNNSAPLTILRSEVISQFDNLENFEYCHKSNPKINGVERWLS